MKKEEIYNEAIGGDEGFAPGEAVQLRATASRAPMCQATTAWLLTQ